MFREKLFTPLYLLILFIVLLDQVTKTWARLYLQATGLFQNTRDLVVMKHILRFTYVENPGMAFGIRVGNEMFFALLATIASLLLFLIMFRLKSFQAAYRYALGCILGGAIGNLIDRLLNGKVIDFIYLEIVDWPVFNIADVAVTLGMILGIVQVITPPPESPHPIEVEREVWLDEEKVPADKVIQ